MEESRDADPLVGQNQEITENSPSNAVKDKTSSDNSEYDSADNYSEDEVPPQDMKARSKASGVDSEESDGSVIQEREEGDGQESAPSKKVDDDEDKKNPQYIPKRGTFYEHDDRTAEDDIEKQDNEDTEKEDPENKKKVWQDKKEKWSHDRFDDNEQAPKSRAELIAIYGYDIRSEDGPPRARRRRRYGRGPNKYTRNWEDEDAYSKPPPPKPQRTNNTRKQKPQRGNGKMEEFPPLGGSNRSHTRSESSESNGDDLQEPKQREDHTNNPQHSKPRSESTQSSEMVGGSKSTQPPRVGTGRIIKPKREIQDSDYRGFTSKSRQQRGMKSENQKVLPPRNSVKKDSSDYIQSQNFTNKNSQQNQIVDIEKEINQLNIQDGGYKSNRNAPSNSNGNQNRQGSVPPRLQNNEQKGSKRYSSMRQRSLPETNNPPTPGNFSFYPNDYNSTAPPPATQQPIMPTPIPPTALVTPQVPASAAPPPMLQVIAVAPQLHQSTNNNGFQTPFAPPTAFATQPPPAYLQAPAPPFITAPPSQPQIVGFVPQAQPPPFVQGFQGQFNAVTQPAELYQPQGGITYYSADQQITQQRLAPQKRPKAAIPIVAPTDFKNVTKQGDGKDEMALVGSSQGLAQEVAE